MIIAIFIIQISRRWHLLLFMALNRVRADRRQTDLFSLTHCQYNIFLTVQAIWRQEFKIRVLHICHFLIKTAQSVEWCGVSPPDALYSFTVPDLSLRL
jgi:hypothetical protein